MKLNSDKMTTTAPQQAYCQYGVMYSAVDGLFCRFIEKPLLGVFVFAKRGKLIADEGGKERLNYGTE